MAEPDIPNLIADLKITVIQGHIRQIIEHGQVMRDLSSMPSTLSHVKDKVDELHVEIVKHKKTEMLEMLGLDKIAAVHEKFQEAKLDDKVAWWDWLIAGLLSIIPLILIPALALLFKGKIIDWFRKRQAGGDENKPIWTSDGNGGFHKESLKSINQREARVWQGGTSVADIVSDPALAQRADALRQKLDPLNTSVEKFNRLAPDFLLSFGKLPREGKATKMAKAVKTISDAIGLVNLTTLKDVAEAIEKLNKAVLDYQPTKIPKPQELDGVATKMGELTTKTETLRKKFEGLQSTVRTLDDVIAGATG